MESPVARRTRFVVAGCSVMLVALALSGACGTGPEKVVFLTGTWEGEEDLAGVFRRRWQLELLDVPFDSIYGRARSRSMADTVWGPRFQLVGWRDGNSVALGWGPWEIESRDPTRRYEAEARSGDGAPDFMTGTLFDGLFGPSGRSGPLTLERTR